MPDSRRVLKIQSSGIFFGVKSRHADLRGIARDPFKVKRSRHNRHSEADDSTVNGHRTENPTNTRIGAGIELAKRKFGAVGVLGSELEALGVSIKTEARRP